MRRTAGNAVGGGRRPCAFQCQCSHLALMRSWRASRRGYNSGHGHSLVECQQNISRQLPHWGAHACSSMRIVGRDDDLPFRVELWDDHDSHVEEVIALASDYATARGAYEEAIKRRPERIVTSRQKIKGAGRQPVKDMARIYVSESGRDKNDGPTKQMPIYSWKRARKISGHIEITVDSAATRKRGRPSLYVGRRDAAVAATSEEFLNAWQSRNLRA